MEEDIKKFLKLVTNLYRPALVNAIKKFAEDNNVEISYTEVEERLDKLVLEVAKGEIPSDDEMLEKLIEVFPELKDFMKGNDFPYGMYA